MHSQLFSALVFTIWTFAPRSAQAAESLPAADQRAGRIKDLNTPREFPAIHSRSEWESRAKEIREQILVSCGLWPLPEKTPLNARIFGKVERGGYSVEKVYFQTFPGFYLGGNLYRPLGRHRVGWCRSRCKAVARARMPRGCGWSIRTWKSRLYPPPVRRFWSPPRATGPG